jgi:hypothetical protein
MPPRRTRRRATLTAAALVVSSLFVAPGIMWGTIEEQRARLPPPADCADPVDGVWLGIEDDAARNNWYEFTLVIHRPDPRKSELVGEVVSHAWSGGKEVKEPPPCAPGRFEHMVHMPADGTVTGNRLYFGGKSVKTDDVLCGSQLPYYPDKFTGTVDTQIEEFQSTNNDGTVLVNEPVVFRRVKCNDQRVPPSADIVPPSFGPKHSGCGR